MKTVQSRMRVLLPVGFLCFVTALLSGCLKDASSSSTSPKSYLSVMHLAPRSPAVDIYFNTSLASTVALNSGTVTSAYTAIDPAAFSVTFKKSGSDSVVAKVDYDIYDTLRYYTLLLYNYNDSLTGALRIQDDYSVLTTDKAAFRFFHMSPGIGPVDLYFDNTLIQSNRQFTDNVTNSYYNQFLSVSPNTVNVYVKKSGSDSVIAQATSVYLAQANAYTIYLKGLTGGSGNNVLSVGVLQSAD